jgi:predicted lipoprotein with Yx(FWY)xxD motif
MKRLLIAGTVLVAALVLVACGDSSSEPAAPASATGDTVGIQSMDGIGDVLVDAQGKALYVADVESDGTIHCTGGCTSFWQPLTIDSGKPTAADGVGKLGVVKRPDGTRQVTADGRPLYSFSQDSAGQLDGNGFSDDFDGQHFTWNAALAGGKVASSSGEQDGGSSSRSYGY